MGPRRQLLWYRALALLFIGVNLAIGCNTGCIQCSSNTVCTNCNTTYYLSSGVCYPCQSNCATCADKGECTQGCKEGYYDAGISGCKECRSGCISCTGHSNCDKCVAGKWGPTCLNRCDSYHCKDNICSQDKAECNNGCTDGYYSNSTSCYGCPVNCETCTSATMCRLCKDGTWGAICDSQCPDSCTTCNKTGGCGSDCADHYYKSSTDNSCTPCPNGCLECSASSVCTVCNTGYVLSETSCIQCPSQCSACSSPKVCTACSTGYVLSETTCIQCPSQCSACSSSNMCTVCTTGYVLSETSCIQCPSQCLACSSSNVCTSCTTGYVLYETSCIQCPSQCSACSSPNVCTACSTGYVLSETSCIQCPSQCSACSSSNVCTSCTTGYVLSETSCIQCPSQCSACSSSSVCTACTTGYVLSETTCIQCPSQCSACSFSNVCTVCTTGYVLSGNTCIQCPTNCSACSFSSECTTCTTGNVLSGSTCMPCPTGCLSCSSGNVCTDEPGLEPTTSAQTSKEDTDVAVIGGAAGGAVIFVIIVVVIVVCILRKRRNTNKSKVPDEEIQDVKCNNSPVINSTNDTGYIYASVNKTKQNENVAMEELPEQSSQQEAPFVLKNAHPENTDVDIEDVEIDDDSEFLEAINEPVPNDNVYYTNVAGLKRSKIQVDRLQDYVEKKTMDDFLNEFKKLPQGMSRPFNDAMKPINRAKNRYKCVYPYDVSRVKLLDGGPNFINANYIDGYNKPTAYIASLGPTHNTMDDYIDFWRMVWQEKVGKIIMLTNLMENGTMKCEQYWPNPGVSQSYGNVVVTCHSEDKYSEHTIKGLTVAKDGEQRSLIHLHYTAWPDKGVPDDVTSLIEFRQKVLSTRAEMDGPVIVHCSAGVGRTGTFIALDILTKEGIAEKSVDIFGCVLGLRSQRVSMVQTEEQYEYIHRSLVHALTFDCQAIQGNQFQQYMADSTEKLHAQSKHIESTVERKSEKEIEAVKRNSTIHDKNRKHADVSGDRYRPRLYLRRKPGASDYINAVFVNSYKAKNRYIVAQTPLPGTVVDFLSLVVQERCPCIVSMDEENIHGKTVGMYLPASNQTLKHGTFKISCISCETTSEYILRKLKINFHGMNGPEEKTISHFQIPSWTKGKLVPEPSTFLKLVQDVEKAADESTDNGRIVIHCLAGGERSGLFCAVSVLIQKMEVDHEVSVVNTVRQIKTRRHSAIPNKEQYVFCHQCVSAYVQSFDIYSNFSHM